MLLLIAGIEAVCVCVCVFVLVFVLVCVCVCGSLRCLNETVTLLN